MQSELLLLPVVKILLIAVFFLAVLIEILDCKMKCDS